MSLYSTLLVFGIRGLHPYRVLAVASVLSVFCGKSFTIIFYVFFFLGLFNVRCTFGWITLVFSVTIVFSITIFSLFALIFLLRMMLGVRYLSILTPDMITDFYLSAVIFTLWVSLQVQNLLLINISELTCLFALIEWFFIQIILQSRFKSKLSSLRLTCTELLYYMKLYLYMS